MRYQTLPYFYFYGTCMCGVTVWLAGHCGHDDGGRSIAAAGEPSSGGVGWAGLTLWELCGTAGGLWALLEGKTESALNVLEVRSSSN
jgi:hypothetical protein